MLSSVHSAPAHALRLDTDLPALGVPIDLDFDDLVHKACDEDVVADLCETPHEDRPPPSKQKSPTHPFPHTRRQHLRS
ncbi:hypothetical protein JAAARDRAFT_62088 [Jaapia argillacea MUCL 33604]|uniref:Uncharacterized protein n=1 Tax=Jaapia argillacea MUCL 33604 TaxID=933084 RepID=A0A067PE56_9AGAM|nr:hypothetical protein JAAARDRAFT_62088 [Jaapia argillacea MUCL 33604]